MGTYGWLLSFRSPARTPETGKEGAGGVGSRRLQRQGLSETRETCGRPDPFVFDQSMFIFVHE
jgi:hypothetical protein